MKLRRLTILFLATVLVACSGAGLQAESPEEAIEKIRALAGFPESELVFIETTLMANSPNGDLKVDLYQDEEGRKFFVEPTANIVVEMDARDLLGLPHSSGGTGERLFSQAELASRVDEFVRAAVPGFSLLQSKLDYEAGAKGDNFFFNWRLVTDEIYFMPPFIQVDMTNTGELFAFYNTVSVR